MPLVIGTLPLEKYSESNKSRENDNEYWRIQGGISVNQVCANAVLKLTSFPGQKRGENYKRSCHLPERLTQV